VLNFITAHTDVFLAILRDRQQNPTQESLQELALTTAVIGRAALHGKLAAETTCLPFIWFFAGLIYSLSVV
jgi:hypothetical protein